MIPSPKSHMWTNTYIYCKMSKNVVGSGCFVQFLLQDIIKEGKCCVGLRAEAHTETQLMRLRSVKFLQQVYPVFGHLSLACFTIQWSTNSNKNVKQSCTKPTWLRGLWAVLKALEGRMWLHEYLFCMVRYVYVSVCVCVSKYIWVCSHIWKCLSHTLLF